MPDDYPHLHNEPVQVRSPDADVLVRAKVLIGGTVRIAQWLQEHGLEPEGASAMGIGHRFSKDGVSVDSLVQDHLGELIDGRGFWRFANDEQAARAAFRILTAAA